MRRYLFVFPIVFVMIFAATAQDDGGQVDVSGAPVTVLPLELVTESDPVLTEITDTTASLNFVGTEPLACYLVYGEDGDYGHVTNDPQMAAAAIIEHNPIMTGLEPDTEYQYRMLGTAEDGTLYVSAVYTFRTLPADETGTDNLLSPENGAEVVAVSSNFGNGANDGRWGILNALDDNLATEWATNGDGDDAFFEVELDGRFAIEQLEFTARSMTDGSSIVQSFTITTEDGVSYGPFEVENPNNTQTYTVDFNASFLRFDVETSTGGNVGAVDVAAYGQRLP